MKLNQSSISKIGRELQSLVKGEVLFDEFSRGRYSTDASIYQITPIAITIPKDTDDVLRVLEYCKLNELPIYQGVLAVHNVVKVLVSVLFLIIQNFKIKS